MLGTAGTAGLLQVEIDSRNHKFDRDKNGCPTSHGRQRRTYSERNAKLLKVRVVKADDCTHDVSTDLTRDQKIDRILIWTERAV